MTSYSAHLWHGSKGPRDRPALPGELRSGPRVCGSDQQSQGTQARVRGPEVSTSSPGGLRLVPEVPRGRTAVPRDLGPCPWARGVDQLPRATRAWVRVPAVLTSSPERLRTWSEVPQVRAVFPGDSGPSRRAAVSKGCPGRLVLCPRASGVEQQSRATRARVRGPLGSTSGPGLLGPMPEGPRC